MLVFAGSVLAVILTASCARAGSVPDGGLELLVLHNNDMHARFEQTDRLSGTCKPGDHCYGGFARVAHVVREARANESAGGPQVLYLNAGDTYQGTPWYTLYKWNVTYMFLNAIAPDAISLGNHEFDDGVSGLVPFLENVKFPVLASNLDLSQEPDLMRQKSLKPSTVFVKNGISIGVIGYLTPDTKTLSAATNVEYVGEVEAINAEARRLKADGIKILIALGHSGYEMDCKIAAEVPDIDLVIGGHTNTFLWNGPPPPNGETPEDPYPKVIIQKSTSKKVPVVQAYAYTKYLGKLHMIFNSQGDLISFDGQPILLDESIPRDKDVLELINVYKPGLIALKSQIVAQTSVLLDGKCRLVECNLGNLVADSMVRAYVVNYVGDKWSDASIAFVSGGGIRSSINSKSNGSNITMDDLMTVLPFGNDLVIAQYKGDAILKALEHSVQRYNGERGYGEFLQMSGVHVTYDVGKKPGKRVVKVEVMCTACEIPKFEPINPQADYKVILNTFMAEGGDGYSMFKTGIKKSIGIGDLKAAENFFKEQSPIRHGIEGRITILNTSPSAASAVIANVFLFTLLAVTVRMII